MKTVQVFLGDPIEDDGEQRVLSRLRADLGQRGIPARIYANFVATGRQQRQVDLLVSTAVRCVQIEVKNFDSDLPLIGQANGPWRQVLPDGQERQLDRNYFRQAREATYAVSDVMRTLARRGDVPGDDRFYRHLDTVVCLHPHIPAGSSFGRFEHVDVIGYDQLVDRLITPGPRPGWDDSHWDAFARNLGMYQEYRESPDEKARRENLAMVGDYRRRFTDSLQLDLHELVTVTARVTGTVEHDPLNAIITATEAGRMVTVTGPSGGGKSHAARHAALALAGRGRLPIWVRCSEYVKGRFSVLLARATAPYSVGQPLELIRRAWDVGAAPVLILDGLNECPPGLVSELLEQLAAARLRIQCAVVITSGDGVPLPDANDVCHVELQLPGPAERQALLCSYGAADCPASDAFQTPFELSMAAECAAELGPAATAADLFDAYVRLRANGPLRAALRRLATEMDAKVRSSLTIPEAALLLERAGTKLGAPILDTVLRCPLLAVRQGRLSFRHEQFGRFLTAEQLVIEAPDPAALARRLEDPRHNDLRELAVGIERDDGRRFDMLLALADEKLLFAAEAGQFGARISARLGGMVSVFLTEAAAATAAAELRRPGEAGMFFGGRWRMPAPRNALETALLRTIGRCLRRGSFLTEVAALLDATDTRCATEIHRLREEGYERPVSAVGAATYCPGWLPSSDTDCLPATLVVAACEQDWPGSSQQGLITGVASTVLQAAGPPPGWGRLYLALTLMRPEDSDDIVHLPRLIEAAWKAGGYHLRLAALNTAVQIGRRTDGQVQTRLVEVLTSFDVSGNVWLSTILVEALAACGAIEPMSTLDQIRAEIDTVLAQPDNPKAWTAAGRLFYRQFENEDIVGPYGEALAELDDRRQAQLYVMAARTSSGESWQPGWVMREIAERAELTDDIGREVLRKAATTVADNSSPVEAAQAHLEGLRGWARIADHLPISGDGDVGQRAWRLVDELIFRLERDDQATEDEVARSWQELHGPYAAAAVDVLSMVQRASAMGALFHQTPQPYDRLVEAYPDQIRTLLQWGLTNRDRLLPAARLPTRELPGYMIGELGRAGDASTVELLHGYVADPELGPLAVEAVRTIEGRLADNA